MMVHGGWDYCSPSLFFCHVSYLCILGRENISPVYLDTDMIWSHEGMGMSEPKL